MKIKRFVAADIRQAMRMVKEELGADAVIMSNRSIPEGVEIVAAKDFDEKVIHDKLPKKQASQVKPQQKSEAETKPVHIVRSQRKIQADGTVPAIPRRRSTDQYLGYAERVALNAARSKANNTKAAEVLNKPVIKKPAAPVQAELKSPENQNSLLLEMQKELRELKSALDNKLIEPEKEPQPISNPIRLDLLRKLTELGIAKKQGIKIANRLSGHTDANLAWEKALEMLGRTLFTVEQSILATGGIVALVGPTGVGKTTTIAKIAAKYILQHGPGTVALITTDNYRIGAHEQLNTYGRILDVPVKIAVDSNDLQQYINSFSEKQLVLIDTAGMSQRDMRVADQISILQQNDLPVQSYLVMSATTQLKTMNEIINAFQIFNPEAAILTKLDEIIMKGPAISALIDNQLPLAFVTNGQQVPEDIHEIEPLAFVSQCAQEIEQEQLEQLQTSEEWITEEYA